jgi:tetratricopeptide (TPR) repeat protein
MSGYLYANLANDSRRIIMQITMKRAILLTAILYVGLLTSACARVAPPTTVEPVAQAAVTVTETAQPTNTPRPTAIPVLPTATPMPPTDASTSLTPLPTALPAMSPAEVHFERGFKHYQQEQWDQAISELQEAIRLDPQFGLAYGVLGHCQACQGKDLEAAIGALETYLQLVPDASNRAQIETVIQQSREALAQPSFGLNAPPGKALFVFVNYTHWDWNIDLGPYFLQAPPNRPGQAYTLATIAIEPGSYTWQAISVDGTARISNQSRNSAFDFSVAEGEIYTAGATSPLK